VCGDDLHARWVLAKVEGFSLGHFRVHIVDDDFFDNSAELQSERGIRPNAATAANDADFHKLNPPCEWNRAGSPL
jgi:hypothetical protein